MSEYIESDFSGGCLCPMTSLAAAPGYSPQVDRHRAWVEIQNEVYDRYERDADGELVGGAEAEKSYGEEITRLAEERLGAALKPYQDEYMRLYRVAVGSSYIGRGRGQVFHGSYLQCPVCLFVLPGTLSGGVR